MAGYYNFNGSLLPDSENIIGPGSRAFRYGEGLFETIRVCGNSIPLVELHISRALKGLDLLGFNIPSSFDSDFFTEQILQLRLKNNLGPETRVRLAFFGGDQPLYSETSGNPNFVIQCWDLAEQYLSLNENGWTVDIFPDSVKSPDRFSSIKSNNYLPYLTGAAWAKRSGLDDALILNPSSRISDSCIANVFWITRNEIFTTPVSEGPVAGVMREWLLVNLPKHGYSMKEKELNPAELEVAEEAFLTNALYGIRWVGRFKEKSFTNKTTSAIFEKLIRPLFAIGE